MGKSLLFRNPIQIGNMLKLFQLLAKRATQGPVTVTEGAGRDTGNSVKVLMTMVIPYPASFPA